MAVIVKREAGDGSYQEVNKLNPFPISLEQTKPVPVTQESVWGPLLLNQATAVQASTGETVEGYNAALVLIYGSSTDVTFTFQGSARIAPGTWVNTYAVRLLDGLAFASVASADVSTARYWLVNTTGYDSLRINVTAIANGNISARIHKQPLGSVPLTFIKEAVDAGLEVQGATAHDAAFTENPVGIGAIGVSTLPTAVTTGDKVRLAASLNGELLIGATDSSGNPDNGVLRAGVDSDADVTGGRGARVYSNGKVWTGSNWVRVPGTAAGGAYVQGPAADGAAATGNPVRGGLVVDDTSPVVRSEGDIVSARGSSIGDIIVNIGDPGAANTRADVAQGGLIDLTTPLYGLVVTAQITAVDKDNNVEAIRSSLNDNSTSQRTLAIAPHLMNGDGNVDYQRNVGRTAYIASAARTATVNGADRTNYNFRGLTLFVNVSAISGTPPTLTPTIQVKDETTGNYISVYTVVAGLTTTGQRAYHLYPTAENAEGWTETFNGTIGARTYRAIITSSSAESYTATMDVIEEL